VNVDIKHLNMKISNTLTGSKSSLKLIPGKNAIGIYVCGVTPYDSAHVGHAMSLMVYDVLIRYLRWCDYEVNFVSNYTDVDDKLIDRARELSIEPLELANRNIQEWEEEQKALGLLVPDVRPRVTQEIESIIEMIQEIIDHGLAYSTGDGDVYYRVRLNSDYGKLSHRRIDDLISVSRSEVDSTKEDPLDFALWKAAKPGEPSWASPWGAGRPGWHIECSAMARRYLGEKFEIHGGGLDLIFPHHENEIAQAEGAANTLDVFAQIWMHNGMVQRDGEKMSKSLGNVVTVQEALDQWSSDAIRLFVLSSHYRSGRNLTDDAMHAAVLGVERLRNAINLDNRSAEESGIDCCLVIERFTTAMDDDVSTPQAVAVLFDLVKEINRKYDQGFDVSEAQLLLEELSRKVLGFSLESAKNNSLDVSLVQLQDLVGKFNLDISVNSADQIIDALVQYRGSARQNRDFALADSIRDALLNLNIALDDTADGTIWTPLLR
jgi:cysteinyl-tRNA synthetase